MFSYTVPLAPSIVPTQLKMLSPSGNAEMPLSEEVIRDISSVCNLLATLALSELEFWLLSDFAVGEPTACCRCVALDIFDDDEDDSRYDFFSVVLVRRSTFTRELMK